MFRKKFDLILEKNRTFFNRNDVLIKLSKNARTKFLD